MPTDKLVDVQLQVKLINVRKSKAQEIGENIIRFLDGKTEDLDKSWDLVEARDIQVIDDMLGGVAVPAKTKPAGQQRMYGKLPNNELIHEYIKENPGITRSEIAGHFGINKNSLEHRLDKLLHNKTIKKIPKGLKKTDGVGYWSTQFQNIAEKTSAPEVPVQPTAQPPAAAPAAGAAAPSPAPVDEKAGELVVQSQLKKLIRQVCLMRPGDEKDEKLKELVVQVLLDTPGLTTANLSDRLSMPTAKLRYYLIELEEKNKIERRLVDGELGQKTGYYVKNLSAAKAVARAVT